MPTLRPDDPVGWCAHAKAMTENDTEAQLHVQHVVQYGKDARGHVDRSRTSPAIAWWEPEGVETLERLPVLWVISCDACFQAAEGEVKLITLTEIGPWDGEEILIGGNLRRRLLTRADALRHASFHEALAHRDGLRGLPHRLRQR